MLVAFALNEHLLGRLQEAIPQEDGIGLVVLIPNLDSKLKW